MNKHRTSAHQFLDHNQGQQDCHCGIFCVLTLLSQIPLIGLRCIMVHIDACCLIQRLNDFIQVFVSFVYAMKNEMGFDPTVEHIMFQNSICYVY